MRKPLWWIAGVLILASAGALYYAWWSGRPAPAAATSTPPPVAEPAIRNPMPASPADTNPPLPALAASDAPFHAGLMELAGRDIENWLVPDNIIRHIVVTVDNLARKRVSVELRPIKPVAGEFRVSGDDQHATLSADNFERYKPYVAVVQKLDAKSVSSLYTRYYPLFQQAYQDLGYPNGYFNDRLVEVIDELLATPEPNGPIALVRPNVMYQYADAQLESASACQKLLLRMGPENAAVVKAKLRELRTEVASRTRADEDSRQRPDSSAASR
jgi:hypothetical protein